MAPHALAFEIGGDRDRVLRVDAGRETAGLYLLRKADVPSDESALPGRTRHALLLFRKHLDGARFAGLARVAGERWLVLECARAQVHVRFASPAATLVIDGAPVATYGTGREAWPPPAEAPQREIGALDAAAAAEAVDALVGERTLARAWLATCPPLGPLARLMGHGPEAIADMQRRLASPHPTLVTPRPLAACTDADLAAAPAVLLPLSPAGAGVAQQSASWRDAAAAFLAARVRGERFVARRAAVLEPARRELRRLTQLEAHLEADGAGLPDAGALRRQAEALLAFAARVAPGADAAELPDPYEDGAVLHVALDPRLGAPANAERLFQKARRIERARTQVGARLADTRRALAEAREAERRASQAVNLADLDPAPKAREAHDGQGGGPRRYLTSRGLTLLVGRGARENHHLTFGVAKPEDLWLHARDVPGAHVILRDNEGRAGADDLREAAEVAAFFSEAAGAGPVDVHVTRRKHVRPGRGGPGRVHVGHSDTLRVVPRDPEGRLRRR